MLRDRARALRNSLTDAERHLWQRLRRKQINGFRFRRQVPLGRYIVDFVCFEARVIVEVDGGQHAEAAMHDRERDRWLSSQGFRVLRFWNNDVLRETDAVIEMIERALTQPPPHPSPARGEGELVRGNVKSCPPHPSPVKGEGELVKDADKSCPPHPSSAKGEGEQVKGADKYRPPHPSLVMGEGERSQAMHEIPPPLAGGGEGEG